MHFKAARFYQFRSCMWIDIFWKDLHFEQIFVSDGILFQNVIELAIKKDIFNLLSLKFG